MSYVPGGIRHAFAAHPGCRGADRASSLGKILVSVVGRSSAESPFTVPYASSLNREANGTQGPPDRGDGPDRRVPGLHACFALAERESLDRYPELADRYVNLARRIGMRYNVRLLGEYRGAGPPEMSTYWVEGRTVRTRLRSGRRVRTCLRCGRQRRMLSTQTKASSPSLPPAGFRAARRDEGALSRPITEESDVVDEETEDE